jgi:hypothetical protein
VRTLRLFFKLAVLAILAGLVAFVLSIVRTGKSSKPRPASFDGWPDVPQKPETAA